MPTDSRTSPETILDRLFREEFVRLQGSPLPDFQIRFYPYTGLTNTIRVRHNKVLLRLSDMLHNAPENVLRSVISILISKLRGIEVARRDRSCYRDFTNQPEFRNLVKRIRAVRGRKKLSSPSGQVFNLESVFKELNETYFCNQVSVQHLSWSARSNRKTLGHYDEAHDAIVLSRSLDDKRVPDFVVKYVLFHEMLHAFLGHEVTKRRRSIHHPRFCRAEQDFQHLSKAKAFIHKYFR